MLLVVGTTVVVVGWRSADGSGEGKSATNLGQLVQGPGDPRAPSQLDRSRLRFPMADILHGGPSAEVSSPPITGRKSSKLYKLGEYINSYGGCELGRILWGASSDGSPMAKDQSCERSQHSNPPQTPCWLN